MDPKWTHTVTHIQTHLKLDTHKSEDHPRFRFFGVNCLGFLKLIVWEGVQGVGPRVGPRRVGPGRVGAQNFALFFPSHHSFSFFSPSLLVFFVEFFWCLKCRGAQMCTFGVLGLCETPGSHTTAQELQTCTLERPGTSNTTKIQRKRPKERAKRMKNCGGREKKREILGPPPFRARPPFWAPPFGAPP